MRNNTPLKFIVSLALSILLGEAALAMADIVVLAPKLKCEKLLTDIVDLDEPTPMRHAFDAVSNNRSWLDFVPVPEATPAAWALIGFPADGIREFDTIHLRQNVRSAKVRHDGRQKMSFETVYELLASFREGDAVINSLVPELSVAWIAGSNSASQTFDVGYLFGQIENARVYLSTTGHLLEGELRKENMTGLAEVRFTLGLEVACAEASKYSRAVSFEKILKDDLEKCRVPLLRFRGSQWARSAPQQTHGR